MTKGDITKRLNALKKAGALVYTFNSQRAMPTGAKGFPDHCIVWNGWVFFAECKLGHDKMSKEQLAFEHKMIDVVAQNECVAYYTITEKNIDDQIKGMIYLATHK